MWRYVARTIHDIASGCPSHVLKGPVEQTWVPVLKRRVEKLDGKLDNVNDVSDAYKLRINACLSRLLRFLHLGRWDSGLIP